MMALIAFSLIAQAPQPVDPLTQRMVQFCRGKSKCVAKQKEGVQLFLNVITRQRPLQAIVQQCLDRSSKRKVTDWQKAARCMKSASTGKPTISRGFRN